MLDRWSSKRGRREGARAGRGSRIAPALALLALSAGSARAGTAWPPPSPSKGTPAHALELVWSDHYGLLKKKLPPWGRESVERHIEEVFRDVGVEVRWLEAAPETERTSGPMVVRIVLVPRTGEGWRLPGEAMGAVMDKRVLTRTLYVFFPSLLRGIGDRSRPGTMLRDPREVRDFTRALARVVTHEVVHAIDPELPHAETEGIMSPRLTPEMLRRDALGFTLPTASRLVAALGAPER